MAVVILGEPVLLQSSTGNVLAITSTGQVSTRLHDSEGNAILNTSSGLAVSSNQHGTWNLTNISGTVSLPTGAATAFNQETTNNKIDIINSSTGLINTKLTTIDADIKAPQPRKLQDGSGNAITSKDEGSSVRSLDINLRSATSGLALGSVKIEDATNSLYKAIVDSSGRLQVATPIPAAPAGTFAVEMLVRGSVGGSTTSDLVWTIPNNTTVTLQKFLGGIYPNTTNASSVELHYDAGGAITANSYLISLGYIATEANYSVDINTSYIGDGTRAVIARRARLDATAREMYVRWIGYVTYNTYTTNASGNTSATTSTVITDASKTWVVNVHANRYVLLNSKTPLKIVSNTATALTVIGNAQLGAIQPYIIVTFNA